MHKNGEVINTWTYVFVFLGATFFLLLTVYVEKFSKNYQKLTIGLAFGYLLGLGFVYNLAYSTNPLLITLLIGTFIPAILLENRFVYYTYNTFIFFFYGITIWISPTTINSSKGLIDVGTLDTPAKISILLSIIVTMFLIGYIRKAVLSHMLGNLYTAFEKVKVSETKYKSLMEGLEEAVYSLDVHNTIITYNSRFLNQFGQSFDSCLGMDYTKLAVPGLKDIESYSTFWIKALDAVKLSKLPFSGELIYQFEGNESENVVDVKLIPIVTDKGQIELIIGSNRDVTELYHARKQVHDLLEHENERLEVLVRIKTDELAETTQELYRSERLASLGRLVAGVAHEINTPLGVALTGSSYVTKLNDDAFDEAQSEPFPKEKLLKYIKTVGDASEIVNNNLTRAAELVSNFKNMAVTQSEALYSKFDLSAYIDAVIMSLSHEYKNKCVTIENRFAKNLLVYSLPGYYAQIITNLVMNSLLHGYVQDKPLEIEISGGIEGNCLYVRYRDNGLGISQDVLSKIFDPFFTTKRHLGGTGLGLSIIYNIVNESLRGNINCESSVGIGTLFTIRVPMVENDIVNIT